MTIHHETRIGLDGAAAAATVLSHVDGERGELVIAGNRVADLAGTVRFEHLAGRLWALAKGAAPREADEAAAGTQQRIGLARQRAFARLGGALDLARGLEPTVAMRAVVAALGPEDGLDDETALTGGFGVAAAALLRQALRGEPVAPDPDLPHAADLLRMIRGATPRRAEADALDAYLVTASDHGMNASTFTGRVAASTGLNPYDASIAGLVALKGPRHGGAGPLAARMVAALGAGDVAAGLRERIALGETIPGFGHLIYREGDPRAEALLSALAAAGADRRFVAEAPALVAEATGLRANIDYALAVLSRTLGLPRGSEIALFAIARSAGWLAPAFEQLDTGTLVRPRARYIGPAPRR